MTIKNNIEIDFGITGKFDDKLQNFFAHVAPSYLKTI